MTTPRSSIPGHEPHGRPKPPPAHANAADDDGDTEGFTVKGGGMFGSDEGALEGVRKRAAESQHADAPGRAGGDASKEGRDRQDDVPIGSALNEAQGMRGAAGARGTTADAGGDLASGPNTLGATTGGERGVAGRTDASRNSRNDHGQLGGGNLEG